MSPVIINEFEIETGPERGREPRGEGAESGTSSAAIPAPQSPVRQIEQVMRRRHERDLRVWAH